MDVKPGDRVTLGVTHQVQIDHNNSWIKLEINSAIQEEEDAKAAIQRVSKLIAANIVNEIERQAEIIVAANEAQRNSASQK